MVRLSWSVHVLGVTFFCVCVCRIATEDGYVKGLTKLYKSASHIPNSAMG